LIHIRKGEDKPFRQEAQVQEELFPTDKALSQTLAILEQKLNPNREMTRPLALFEFYEFSMNRLVALLLEASFRIIPSLPASEARQRQPDSVHMRSCTAAVARFWRIDLQSFFLTI
jgi:hypothetical protein